MNAFPCDRDVPGTMSSSHAKAPEVPGSIDESSSEAQWPAAARSQEEFVYATGDDAGHVVSWHLMEWHPQPKRAHDSGIGSHGRDEVRIHVCRHAPCTALKHHPSKYGSAPCPQMHRRIVDWGRAAWCKYAGDGAPEICSNADGAIEQAASVVAIASADSEVTPCVIPAEALEVTARILRRATEIESPGRSLVYGKCCVGVACSRQDAAFSWQKGSSTLWMLSLQMSCRTRGRGGHAPMS